MKPKYKPGDELIYLGKYKATVEDWAGVLEEYRCRCPAMGEEEHDYGIFCQEKDLKPIRAERLGQPEIKE